MISLVGQALMGVAGVALLGAILEFRTAWRFARLRRGTAGDAGRVEVEGIVESSGSELLTPLSQMACVLFSLVLTRQRRDHSGRSALLFVEQRPFVIAMGHARLPVDPKKDNVVIVGLDAKDTPLHFLPHGVLGLLVSRFGHLGHVWAEDFVLRARESALFTGQKVHALVENGRVVTLSTQPLSALSASARQRGLKAIAIALPTMALGYGLMQL
jgi:hypothetical protein